MNKGGDTNSNRFGDEAAVVAVEGKLGKKEKAKNLSTRKSTTSRSKVHVPINEEEHKESNNGYKKEKGVEKKD